MAEKEKEIISKKEVKRFLDNPWAVSTGILVLALIIILGYNYYGGLTKSGAEDLAVKFFTEKVGAGFTVSEVEDVGDLYHIVGSYQLQPVEFYVTKDGKYVTTYVLEVEENLDSNSSTETETTEIPKSDKPKVELFVMAFCPYGVQAEQAMKPVYDLLKDKADINVRFIVNVGGNNLSDVQSLHGAIEAEEDARQLCIMKEYPTKFWDYVMDIDTNCYPNYRTEGNLATCWKSAANKLSISVTKIESCVSKDAVALLKAEETITNQYGVSGSPTLIINGVQSNGGRTADAYKEAICSAFNTAPAECDTVLSSDTEAASGNC